MSVVSKRTGSRFAAALLAATAMLVAVIASPASAVTGPEDVAIKGLLKGGFIDVHDYEGDPFPLGEKDGEPDDCDKDEGRSQINAVADSSGALSDFAFSFAQGSTGESAAGLTVCVQLNVANEADLVADPDGKSILLTDGTSSGGPEISVSVLLKSGSSVVSTCTTPTVDVGPLEGEWSEPKLEQYPEKHEWDWNLDVWNQAVFEAQGVQGTGFFGACPNLVASAVNSSLGLPSDVDLHMKFIVYDCDKPGAWEGCNKS